MLARKEQGRLVEARSAYAVVVGDLHRGAEVDRSPLQRGIAELTRERERLLDLGQTEARVPRAELDRRMSEQSRDAFGRQIRCPFERFPEPVASLPQLDPAQPERPDHRTEAKRFLRVGLEQCLERDPKIALLCVESRELLVEAPHELHQPRGVPQSDSFSLPRCVQPPHRVAANRLEQPVAPQPVAVLARDERLIDEVGEQECDLDGLEAVAGAHLLDRLQDEATRENREPPEERRLVGREEVVTPVERRLERLLAGRGRAASCTKETEPIVETVGECGGRERVDACGRELECQRKPVEAMTDPSDGRRRLSVERKARRHGSCPLDEEADRLVAMQGVRLFLTGWIRNPERRNPEDDFPRDAQRLAARGEHGESRRTPEQRIDEGGGRADHVLAVVEDEQQRERLELHEKRVEDGTAPNGA